MKKRRITNITVLIIFLSILLFINNGLADFKFSKKQESMQDYIEQDSLTKSKMEIIENFEKSQREIMLAGVHLENTPPLVLYIPFNFNLAELTKATETQLDELGKAMQSEVLSGILIKFAGHTDEIGAADYNLKLSQRRVESAKNYLLRNYDIQPNRIYEIGYGESKPIIKFAKTEDEHSVNRRVEISLWESGKTRDNSINLLNKNLQSSDGQLSGQKNFEWGIFHIKDNNSHELIRPDGTSILKSNDNYRIYIKPPKSSYVYIYQEDSNGNGAWLFPREEVDIKNPLSNNDNWIPSRNGSFSLDDNTGTETIYLVASNKPVPIIDPDPDSQDSSIVITFKIKTRGKEQTRGVKIIEGKSESDINVIEIQDKNWELYVEITFKHK